MTLKGSRGVGRLLNVLLSDICASSTLYRIALKINFSFGGIVTNSICVVQPRTAIRTWRNSILKFFKSANFLPSHISHGLKMYESGSRFVKAQSTQYWYRSPNTSTLPSVSQTILRRVSCELFSWIQFQETLIFSRKKYSANSDTPTETTLLNSRRNLC